MTYPSKSGAHPRKKGEEYPYSDAPGFVTIADLLVRIQEWGIPGGAPQMIADLLEWEAYRIRLDAGTATLETEEGIHANIDQLFAKRSPKARKKPR